jgi:hypothetical protein
VTGWHITVFRQNGDGASPATAGAEPGPQIAVWQARDGGLGWLNALVERGDAISLETGGYPTRYTARAEHLLPPIEAGPPVARTTWIAGPTDVLTAKWAGKTAIDRAVIAQCRADEWLLVEAWDES